MGDFSRVCLYRSWAVYYYSWVQFLHVVLQILHIFKKTNQMYDIYKQLRHFTFPPKKKSMFGKQLNSAL